MLLIYIAVIFIVLWLLLRNISSHQTWDLSPYQEITNQTLHGSSIYELFIKDGEQKHFCKFLKFLKTIKESFRAVGYLQPSVNVHLVWLKVLTTHAAQT